MNIEAILRLVLLITAVIGLMVGLGAYNLGAKKRSANVLIAVVVAWSAITLGGGIWITPKIGRIVAEEGLLLALALVGALVGGLLAGRWKSGGSKPTVVTVAFGLLVLLDLTAFYRLNHQLVEIAGELGLGGPAKIKYEPTANKDCPENLKSLYFAFAQYVDGNGSLPAADKWMENPEIISKVQKDEWLHCPEVSNRHDDHFGYAYNEAVAGKDLQCKKLNEMPNAAQTPLLYDSTNLAKSAHDAFTSLPSPGRHSGRNNVLYCDGHVDAIPAGNRQ